MTGEWKSGGEAEEKSNHRTPAKHHGRNLHLEQFNAIAISIAILSDS
jgi:hypothetical protein